MKNIFRAIGFGLAIAAFSATGIFAQAANSCEDAFEVKNAEYVKFKDLINNNVNLDRAKEALKIGENFTTKYKDCDDTKPVVDYMNNKMPAIKDYIRVTERNNKFDNGVKNKNWNDAFSAGKQIVDEESAKPVSLDVALTLASLGFDRAFEKNDTFNNETIAMAELAIKKLDAGVTTKTFGLHGTSFVSSKFTNTKENVLGWMNYIIGYIKFNRQNKQKEALPYFYAVATKYNSEPKSYADVFQSLGIYYFTELKKIDDERVKIFEANGKKENEQTLAMWDLEKGYFDRAIDAYARAYKIASGNVATAKPDRKQQATAYKDSLYKTLQGFYQERFEKLDGLDAHITAQTAKPLPDPTSEVQPVKEVAPTTTTSTTTNPTNTTTKPTTTTTSPTNTTKPTTNTTTKPTTNTTTKPSGSTKAKPTAKKKSGR